MLLRQLFEALNQQQKDYLDKMMSQENYEYDPTKYDDIFGVGNARIYLPMPETVKPNQNVIQTLEQLGYTVTNYRAGLAILSQPKQYDIRRVLGKNPELLAAWENDPYKTDPTQLAVTSQVTQGLNQYGYSIVDYKNGILTRENKPESIGGILQKHKVDPAIIKAFTNDPARAASTQDTESNAEEMNTNDQVIVITRDKYESAEVGTNKKWVSCLNLGGGWEGADKYGRYQGTNAYYLVRDVSIGCIAAYLINKNDTELDDPIARLSIKPFINKADPNQVALGVHDKVYHREGRPYPEVFKTIVHDWANEINASKELDGMFELHPKAYNWDEIKPENKKQYHGNYKTDKDTYNEYDINIHEVPEEKRTLGYLKIVAEERPAYWEKIIKYCKNIHEIIAITKITVDKGHEWTAYIPIDFIEQDPNAYFDLLDYSALKRPNIFNEMARYNLVLSDMLYTLDSKRFLQSCQQAINKSEEDDLANPLFYLANNSDNTQLLGDLLTLKNLKSHTTNMILDHLIESDVEIDKDILISLINNPRTEPEIIEKVTNYAINSDIPEIEEVLEKRTHIISKSIMNDLDNVSSTKELKYIVNDLTKLSHQVIFLDHSIYAKVLNNEYIDDDMIIETLKAVGDSSFIRKYVNTNEFSIQSLGDISYEFGDEPELSKIIDKKWYKMVDNVHDEYEAGYLSKNCYNPKIITKLILNNNKLFGSILWNALEKIAHNEYSYDGLLELGETMITYISNQDTSELYDLDKLISRILNEADYKRFTNALNVRVYSDLTDEKYNHSSLREYIKHIDYNNKFMFKALLGIDELMSISRFGMILTRIADDYEDTAEKLYNEALPYFVKFITRNNVSSGGLYQIYELGIDQFNKEIVKNLDTLDVILLYPEPEDSQELVKLKLDKLKKFAENDKFDSLFIHHLKSKTSLPEETQEVLLKRALNIHDYKLLNALLSSDFEPIKEKVEQYITKAGFQTLNAALDSSDLVDEWPFGRNVNYGEDANVPVEGGQIHITRFMNGMYSRPTFIKSDKKTDTGQPPVSMRELVDKGKETGFIYNNELNDTLEAFEKSSGRQFRAEDIDDIITMFNDLGIRVVSQEPLSENIDKLLVSALDRIAKG